MPADPADLGARIVEAAALDLRRRFFDGVDSPAMVETSRQMVRAALAAAVREAGLTRAAIHDFAGDMLICMEPDDDDQALADMRMHDFLRALAGIADG